MRLLRRPDPRRTVAGDRPGPLTGVAPDGSEVTVTPGAGRTVVVFLSSGCRSCRRLWPGMSALAAELTTRGTQLVLVTPGPGTERRTDVAGLAPPAVPTVMDDASWFSWRAGAAPWVVVLDDGEVVAAGNVTDLAGVTALAA